MFKDRKDAGRQLGKALLPYNKEGIIILAIPKGGVEIAYHVAKVLDVNFDVVVCRKLRYPGQPELALGAIAEDKSLYLNPSIQFRLSKETIEKAVATEEETMRRQIGRYREGKPLPVLQNKTVIIVDDGIATGSTLMVSIDLCRKKGAGRIIVAAPVASPQMYRKLKTTVEDVVILETPRDFMAVSQAYREFGNLDDEDVISLMHSFKISKKGKNSLSS